MRLLLALFLLLPTLAFAQIYPIDGTGSGTATGGSATNAQPPSDILTNLANVGLSTSNILWVSPAGNDATGARARLDKPWATPNSAMSNAIAGDTVMMMPGYYNIGTNSVKIKHGAHLVGFGRNASVIQFSGNLNRGGPAVILGSTSYVAHMTIECTDRSNNFQAAIGTLSGKFFAQDFTNAFVEDIRAVGGSDAAFIDSPNPLSATFKGCQFESFFDGFTIGSSSGAGYHTIVLQDSTILNDSTFHGAFSPALNYAVTTQYGTTTVRRCSIFNKGAIGVASNSCAGIFAAADDALDVGVLNVENCVITCVISNDTIGRFISSGTAGATNVFVYGTTLNRGAGSGPGVMDADGILWANTAGQPYNYFRQFPSGGVRLGSGGGDPGNFSLNAHSVQTRATNVSSMLSGRYTNDATGLLDSTVLISAAEASGSLKRTNLLFSASAYPGREITIVDGSKTATGSNIYIATVSSQTINGGPTITNLTTDNASVTLISDGSNFRIKGSYP